MLVAAFGSLGPKGEFETTADYEARRNASVGTAARTVIIPKQPEGLEYFEYDADAQKLKVLSYAFDNTGLDVWSAFYAAELYGKIDVNTFGNVEVVISREENPTGSHVASNAYGATVDVLEIAWTTRAIFDRQGDGTSGLDYGLFPSADNSPYVVGELSLAPAEAQRLKPTLQVGFVVTPREPYLVTGRHKVGKTTIQNPRAITEDFSILIADIQCGVVMDSSDKILMAYPTR